MKIWLCVGQAGALEGFTTLAEATQYLNSLAVGTPTKWRLAGVETQNYWGEDYISIFWGDDRGIYLADISRAGRCKIASSLADAEL